MRVPQNQYDVVRNSRKRDRLHAFSRYAASGLGYPLQELQSVSSETALELVLWMRTDPKIVTGSAAGRGLMNDNYQCRPATITRAGLLSP